MVVIAGTKETAVVNKMLRTRPPERAGEAAVVARLAAQLRGLPWCRDNDLDSHRIVQIQCRAQICNYGRPM